MKQGVKIGLIGGIVAVLLSLIGMVEAFSQRDIIAHFISMGHTLLFIVALFKGYLVAKRTPRAGSLKVLANSIISGLLVGALLLFLVMMGSFINLRKVFINASPLLYSLLTFDLDKWTGTFLLLVIGGVSGLLAGIFYLAPGILRRVLLISLGSIVGAGVLQDLLRPTFALWGPLAVMNEWLFAANGLTFHGAIRLFVRASSMVQQRCPGSVAARSQGTPWSSPSW